MDATTVVKEKFKLLPEAMRNWLTSDKTTNAIIDINQRLNIYGEKLRVIPWTITRLSVGDLPPGQFVSEIQNKLAIPQSEAEKIAREIKEKILNPISFGLKNVSRIDIGIIPGATPTSNELSVGMELRPLSQTVGTTPEPVVNLRPAVKTEPVKVPAMPKIPGTEAKPFMLHEETVSKPLPQQNKESFSFHIPVNIPSTPRPAPAKFGSSFEDILKKPAEPNVATGGDNPKVVHYHAYRSLPKLTEKQPRKN